MLDGRGVNGGAVAALFVKLSFALIVVPIVVTVVVVAVVVILTSVIVTPAGLVKSVNVPFAVVKRIVANVGMGVVVIVIVGKGYN